MACGGPPHLMQLAGDNSPLRSNKSLVHDDVPSAWSIEAPSPVEPATDLSAQVKTSWGIARKRLANRSTNSQAYLSQSFGSGVQAYVEFPTNHLDFIREARQLVFNPFSEVAQGGSADAELVEQAK